MNLLKVQLVSLQAFSNFMWFINDQKYILAATIQELNPINFEDQMTIDNGGIPDGTLFFNSIF